MCVKCGREGVKLVDGRLCLDCYIEVRGFGSFPKKVEVTVCPRCGGYRYQGRWFPAPLDASSIEDVIREVLRLTLSAAFRPNPEVEAYRVESVEYVEDRFHGDYAIARVVARLRGFSEERSLDYKVRVEVKKQLCPHCFKKAGGAVEAILQVRGYGGRLTEEQRRAVEEILRSLPEGIREYIVEVVEQREGFDLVMVDQGVAKAIAARLRSALAAKIVESWKVVGRRSDGKPKKRLTVSVRIPFFRVGSLVEWNGGLYRVVSIEGGYVYIRRVGARRARRLLVEDAWRLLQPPSFEDVRRVLVAAVTPSSIHLQLLEGSYEYLELPKSRVFTDEEVKPGSEMLLVRYNDRYYLFQPEALHG